MATRNKKKRKDPQLYTYDKYECWWEDHASDCQWKAIKEAEKDKPQICCTEGYLVQTEIGDQMIVANKNILELKKVGTKTFYVKDFDYGEWK